MPRSDALRDAIAHTESLVIAVKAEIEHLHPERWPGTLARLAALVTAAREEARRAGELLEEHVSAR